MAGPCANSNIGVVTLAPSQRRFPPPWTIRDLLHGLLIALTFPGHLIWELAKYCNSEGGRLGKIGVFVVLSPMFGFSGNSASPQSAAPHRAGKGYANLLSGAKFD
jgi:hypothetical protein